RFVLVSPTAVEADDEGRPVGKTDNAVLAKYATTTRQLAEELGLPFVDVFAPSAARFDGKPGFQYTINGIHANERGDRLVATAIDRQLFVTPHPLSMDVSEFDRVRQAVND